MKNIYVFVLSILSSVSVFSQITFEKHYSAYPKSQAGNSIGQTFDGGYVVSGSKGFTSDRHPFLMKLDINGDTVWSRLYNYPNWIGMDGGFSDILQLSDSGFIMCGYIKDSLASCLFVRTDKYGDTIWVKVFSDSLGAYPSTINLTTDGGYITTSAYVVDTLNDHFNIIKLDTFGNISWIKPFYFGHIRNGVIFETSDHGYALIGTVKESYMYASDNRMFLAKLDSTGDSLWTKKYFIRSSIGRSGVQTYDDGYIISGIEWNDSVPNAYVVKTNPNGDTLWTNLYGGTGLYAAYGNSIQQTQDLGFIIAGTIDSIDQANTDVLLIKTDSSGNEIWSKSYTMLQIDYGFCVRETSDGGFVINGTTEDFINYTQEILVIKTDTAGSIITGISEKYDNINDILIYPNPSFGSIQIRFFNPADVNSIVILDTIGKELQRIKNITDPLLSISVNHKPGIYYVQIIKNRNVSTYKIILM